MFNLEKPSRQAEYHRLTASPVGPDLWGNLSGVAVIARANAIATKLPY
jgi:hypothetical protein